MIDHLRPIVPGATRHAAWAALLLTVALLQGCAPTAAPPSRLRVYAADVTGGAKLCDVPRITPVGDKTTEAAITVGNDGGWCGLPVSQSGPKPYDAGLLTARPTHGTVLIHSVGDTTRIDYTPDRGFTGQDEFSVKLLPTDATLHMAVSVTPPTK